MWKNLLTRFTGCPPRLQAVGADALLGGIVSVDRPPYGAIYSSYASSWGYTWTCAWLPNILRHSPIIYNALSNLSLPSPCPLSRPSSNQGLKVLAPLELAKWETVPLYSSFAQRVW